MLIRIDLADAAQRWLRVELECAVVDLAGPPGEGEFFMPTWTPGSYLVREYARHVTGFSAFDAESDAGLEWRKSRKNRYAVTLGSCRRVRLRYAIYAHELTVRTAFATEEFAFWNGASTYLWPVGRSSAGVDLTVVLPADWGLHSGVSGRTRADGNERTVHLRDLDEAVDTPFLAGRPEVVEFEACGRPFRFVFAGLAGIEPPAAIVDDARAIVEASARVFDGTLPVEEYAFLSVHGAEGRGGLEHATSSLLLAPRTTFEPRSSYEDYLALVAHELFHLWNVKRMRPAELWEFDYERENHTGLLWVAEGFTAYYDDHLCLRAGVLTPRRYLDIVAGHVRSLRASAGRFAQSLDESSFDAWIRFYRPDENTTNATQNYYSNGALLALLVDARIRRASGGERSLDTALATLYASTHGQRRGYDFEDVARSIDEAAGVELGEWLRALVRGPFDPDFNEALSAYGLELRAPESPKPFLGLRFRADLAEVAGVLQGSPAWRAGVCPGDEVLAVAGLRVTRSTWDTVFGQVARAGEPLEVLIARRGQIVVKSVEPEPHPHAGLTIDPVDDSSDEALRLREGWLGTRDIGRAGSGS